MGLLKSILIVAALVYVIVCALLYFMQERVIFAAPTERVQPQFGWIEALELQTDDDETIIGWYAPAEHAACPTIIFFHGNAAQLDWGAARFKKMHEAGLGFLAIAYRGYSGSSGRPSESGMITDAQTAWRWLTENKDLSSDQIVIHGHSMGSGVAVQLAAEHAPRALIMESPFYSIQSVIQQRLPNFPISLLLKHKFRSDLHIANISAPILMAHGSEDKVVPISQSQKLFERAPDPKTYKTIAGQGHNNLVGTGLYETAIWPFLSDIFQECSFAQKEEVISQ